MKESILSVFLSHSHKDIDKVRKIRNILETINIDPIMFYLKCLDDDNDVLEDFIKREIESRNIFIYCKSPNSENSVWVQKELDYIRQIDNSRLYVIDIEDDFEYSLVALLQTLTELIKWNSIILCHAQQQDDIATANKIGTALEGDGYNTEFLPLWTGVPSMKGLPFWEFQKYKQTLETILEEEVEPLIQKVANKGIFVLLLSPHFFEFDEQWANMFMTKMAFILKRHNCLYVSVRLAYPLTDEKLKEINKSIYRISLDQANKALIKTDNI